MPGDLLLEAYPLTWPTDQTRTPRSQRERGRFEVGFGRARDELLAELGRMGAREIIISSNVPLRRDGLPFADAREPEDPGVAVYFTHGKRQLVIACDSYSSVRANLRAVGATVEALRAIQRHGATSMLERAFTGFAALPPKGGTERPWWEVLGVTEHAPADVVKAAYRRLAAEHHPDRGGDQDKMAQLNRAYETAQARRMLGP
jgi:hypothetical protein